MSARSTEARSAGPRSKRKKSMCQITVVVKQPASKAAIALGPGALIVLGVQGRYALREGLADLDGSRCSLFFFDVIARSIFRCCCCRLQERRGDVSRRCCRCC
jgi:hypothetical protein